jgi:hypothetical protein
MPFYSLGLSAYILLALRQWCASCATLVPYGGVCNHNLGLRDPNVAHCICAYTVQYVNIETVVDQNITSACYLKILLLRPSSHWRKYGGGTGRLFVHTQCTRGKIGIVDVRLV